MSADNPVIVLIFIIYSLVSCWGNVSNSNVTMKFTQLHYLSSQNVVRGTCPPSPHELGPCSCDMVRLRTTYVEQFLFCFPLAKHATRKEMFKKVDSFTKEHHLSRTHSVFVCADGVYSAMIRIKKTF